MKSTLTIKDLSVNKELDCKTMSAVRGGINIASFGNFTQTVAQGGGIASPSTNVGVYAPTSVMTDTKVDFASLTNVLGNMNARLGQV